MKKIYKVECNECGDPLKYRATRDGCGDYTIKAELCRSCMSNKFINTLGDVDNIENKPCI